MVWKAGKIAEQFFQLFLLVKCFKYGGAKRNTEIYLGKKYFSVIYLSYLSIMKNREIIKELLNTKNLLNQAGKKEIFFEFGLTVGNYEVLSLIKEENLETISEISERLSESLASLTQKTKKLESLGYLKKQKDKTDPRKNILEVTKKGEKTLERVEKKIEVVSSLIFRKYKKDEKELFFKMLKNLNQKLEIKVKK